MKYIDADKLIAEIERRISIKENLTQRPEMSDMKESLYDIIGAYQSLKSFITSLQQEQPIPDSTQLIAEWEKEKAVLEQKDFRGDAERMAYNAFLDGFVKGLGYEGTR